MSKVVCRKNVDAAGSILSSPRDGMNGMDWANLLIESPQFAERCPWNELNDRAWEQLLSFRPEFAAKCDFSKLSELTCRILFTRHHELFSNCRAGTLSGQNDFSWDLLEPFSSWAGNDDHGKALDKGVSCSRDGDSFYDILRLWCQREKIVQKTFVSLSRFIADQKRNASGENEAAWTAIERGHPLLFASQVILGDQSSSGQLREEVICSLRVRGEVEVDTDCRTCESRMKCTYRTSLLGEYHIWYDKDGKACRDKFTLVDEDDFRNGCPEKADTVEWVGA